MPIPPDVCLFGILAKGDMESPLHRYKYGVRGGPEFSQQEKRCFLLKLCGAMEKPQASVRQSSHEKAETNKYRGLSLKLEL